MDGLACKHSPAESLQYPNYDPSTSTLIPYVGTSYHHVCHSLLSAGSDVRSQTMTYWHEWNLSISHLWPKKECKWYNWAECSHRFSPVLTVISLFLMTSQLFIHPNVCFKGKNAISMGPAMLWKIKLQGISDLDGSRSTNLMLVLLH